MGSSQSYLSGEAALTALVVAGALGLGYSQISASRVEKPEEKEKTKGKGKGKKAEKNPVVAADDTNAPAATPPTVLQKVIPGQFDAAAVQPVQPSAQPKTKKAKKKKGKAASATAGTSTSPTATPPAVAEEYHSESSTSALPEKAPLSSSATRPPRSIKQSTTSIDTDGSWTRVEPRSRKLGATTTTSDAATTTASSSPVTGRTEEEEDEEGAQSSFLLNANTRDDETRRRTLAEKLLPKPRKTGVDDMLETPDYPELARVMRVQPRPDEKPASGFSWGDYEDVRETGADADAEDEGWGVVKSKKPLKTPLSSSSTTTLTAPPPSKPTAPDQLTKKQRQNLAKREREKAAKAQAESERLALLAQHKSQNQREGERAGGGGKKQESGGMKAVVDEKGKLVWE